MARLVTGLYRERSTAELAVERLIDAGFSRDDISILMSDSTRGREFVVSADSKAPEGAAAGAALGGALGAIAAGLVALGVVVVPGVGLVAAGPLIAALAGAGAGGAAGGLIGGLVGAGIPEHEAQFISSELEKGGILVGVYTHDDRSDAAKEVFDTTGAEGIKTS